MNESIKLTLSIVCLATVSTIVISIGIIVPQVGVIILGVVTGVVSAKSFFYVKDWLDARAADRAMAEFRRRRGG